MQDNLSFHLEKGYNSKKENTSINLPKLSKSWNPYKMPNKTDVINL